MSVKFSNNASTTLASGVSSSATSITVANGSVFPALSSGNYFYVTLEDINNTKREIVKCTALSSNALTIVRAQDNTTAQTFSSSDKAELRITAAGLNDVASQADTDTNTTYTAGTGLALAGTEFSNTAPDRTVGLTGAGATTISGTYPNFTITSTDNNTTYSVQDGELSQNNFTNADHTKLNNLDSSDYATAAQGTLAANALPKSGGTVTGALVLNNTGSLKLPVGTTAQRESSPSSGMFRFNSTSNTFEAYSAGSWGDFGAVANGSVTTASLSTALAARLTDLEDENLLNLGV